MFELRRRIRHTETARQRWQIDVFLDLFGERVAPVYGLDIDRKPVTLVL